MSSILIKGMEMPSMMQAYVGLIIGWNGKVYPFIPPQWHELGESVATAVPVPTHGRLIDADAIPFIESDNGCQDDYAFRYDINEMQTIIPAEVVE